MNIKLEFDTFSGAQFAVQSYDADLDNIVSLLSDVCNFLQDKGNFVVSGFGQNPWPVDVRTDLCTFLEQLPELHVNIFAGLPGELDLYEQGTECTISFEPKGKRYAVSCFSRTDWQPQPALIEIDRSALEQMLAQARWDFIRILSEIAPALLEHPWMRQWINGVAYFG